MRAWLALSFLLVCCASDEDGSSTGDDSGSGGTSQVSGGANSTSGRGGKGAGGSRAGSGSGALGGTSSDAGAGDMPGDAGADGTGAGRGGTPGSGGSVSSGGNGGRTGGASGTGQGGSSGRGGGGLPPVSDAAIVGFGVNGQPRNWGTDGAGVRAALDLLVDDLGSNLFRVEIFRGESDWEAENDDGDPTNFDWTSYDAIFESKDFRDLWDYIRYLNAKGVVDIELAAHGWVPGWMGGGEIDSSQRDEFVETMLAVLLYARTRAPEPRPIFTSFAPWNETNLGTSEGVAMGPEEGVGILRSLVERMNEYPELDDLGIVAPEASDAWESEPWQEPMVEDPVIAPRLRAIGFHRYGDLYEVEDWDNQPVPWWLTEFNAGEGFCYRANWGTGMELAIVLVRGLLSGVKAGMVWTDYDAPHSHSGDAWESFGLLATTLDGVSYLCDAFPEPPSQSELDQMTYEPKPTYYAAKHAFRHIQRGALRRSINEVEGIEWVAFDNPDGSTVVYGLKSNDGDVEVELGDGAPTSMEVYVSTEGDYYREAGEFTLENGSGSVDLPGDSVFTLVGGP